MSINIGDNLSYLGAKPLDGRLKYDTVSEMAGMADNVLYEGCLAYCVGTGKTYQWKSTNAVDPTTGKWREFTSGGGTAEDPIEYVSQLPTSGIEDKIYGLAITGQISRTIDLINPVQGLPTKQQAIDYFSQYFTVTDVDADNIEIGVPPDLVLSRQNWGSNDWVAGRDFNKLYYNVSSAELNAYMDSTSFASTGAWGATSYYYIHCTSTYFPTYKYYAGVESSQELNELGAGGGSVDDVIDDVETLPTSDVQNIFYRTTQEQVITRYTDTTTTAIMNAMQPYGFTQGETVTNYETHTGNIYSTVTYLDNARHVYDNFDKPLQIYMFQPQGESYYKLGCISNGVDAFWNANDPVGFKLGDNGLYAGKSSNNSTNRVAMFDEMSKTFRGTRTQWNALSTAEKKTYDGCALTDDYNAGDGGGNANIFTGTRADWESLTDEQKAVYDQVNLTDDLAGGEMAVVDEVANGNLNPVTSNAVYDIVANPIKLINALFNPNTRRVGVRVSQFLDNSGDWTHTATLTGAYQFLFCKKDHGNTVAIYINNTAVCNSPWWGSTYGDVTTLEISNFYWTPTIYVNKGDTIKISCDNNSSDGQSRWFLNSYNCWGDNT